MRIEPDGQRFDAEATVGIERPTQFPGAFQQQPQPRVEPPAAPPPPAEPAASSAEEPPKKKRRKGKIIALVAVVLLLLAGGGVAAAMPKVSNRLGLPWAPNAPKGDSPDPAAATRQLQGPDTSGQAPTANGVKSVLTGPAGNSALGQLNGSVVDPVSGTTLWDHSAATAVTPASTTKVLTTAAALLALDPNTRLSTKIVQGADPGTVILVGGGDVTLTSLPLGTESPLYPGAAHVDDLVAQVKKANPNVKKVQVDLSLFKGATTAPGWAAGDAPSTFATQIGSVMADAGRLDPKNNTSMRVANAGSALASTIASKLSASGGGQAAAPKDAKVLAEVKSAPLTELVSDTMELSDDVLAEALARQVALATGQEATLRRRRRGDDQGAQGPRLRHHRRQALRRQRHLDGEQDPGEAADPADGGRGGAGGQEPEHRQAARDAGRPPGRRRRPARSPTSGSRRRRRRPAAAGCGRRRARSPA